MTGQPVVVNRELSQAYYAYDSKYDATFVLTDIDPAALRSGTVDEGVFVHIELLWRPKPGQTPIDSTATNASIRYVVVANDEIGVYEGGGFIMPRGKLDNDRVRLQVRQASVQLQHATPGFNDLLGTAELTGSFTAVNDPVLSRQIHFAMSQLATNVLGKSIFVQHPRKPAASISS